MHCPEYQPEYSIDARRTLLGIARAAIELGLEGPREIEARAVADLDGLEPQFIEHRATFVTLRKFDELRGCTGSLEARRPLVEDVAANACQTAFYDPRFPGLGAEELARVSIEISVLSPLRLLQVTGEEDLLNRLDPSMGLVIEDRGRRGTFLPKVWESLPDPRVFLAELKYKAGIPVDYWSPQLQIFSYHTETFAESA